MEEPTPIGTRGTYQHWISFEELQEPSSEEEFVDAQENVCQQDNSDVSDHAGHRRSSTSRVAQSGCDNSSDTSSFLSCGTGEEPQFDKRVEQFRQMYGPDASSPAVDMPPPQPTYVCGTQILFLILHGGNLLESNQDAISRRRDLANLRATFNSVVLSHYDLPPACIQFRLVACPNLCKDTLSLLSRLSLYTGHSGHNSVDRNWIRNQNFVPLGAIAIFSAGSSEYQHHVRAMVVSANKVYNTFVKSEEGKGFTGQTLTSLFFYCISHQKNCHAEDSVWMAKEKQTKDNLAENSGGRDEQCGSDLGNSVDDDCKLSRIKRIDFALQDVTRHVCLLADAVGSLLAYDALTTASSSFPRGGSRRGSQESAETSSLCADSTVYPSLLNSQSRRLSLSEPNLAPKTTAMLASKFQEICKIEDDLLEASELYESCKEELTVPVPETVSSRHSKWSCGHQNGAPGENNQKDRPGRNSSGGQNYGGFTARLDFDVSDFFMCGAPLGTVLAFRRFQNGEDDLLLRPACHQVYNLFHSSDPTAVRLEPLIHGGFSYIPPMNICRYSKFPLGDGEPVHVVETIQKHLKLFTLEMKDYKIPLTEHPLLLQRQNSLSSMTSTSSGLAENSVASITSVTRNWWGVKRVDYVLYCPEVLQSFPTNALPHLFHSSFWESTDMAAFILRQVLRQNEFRLDLGVNKAHGSLSGFMIKTPREKWLKRRTTIKVRNLQPNHRANDVIVLENMPQILTAKFIYGSLDITSLSGEKVDVNIMKQPPAGDWSLMATKTTDSNGRFSYTIPPDERLPQGLYPVKLVVRGDHTSVDFFMAVLPPKTEAVVFSIDGSFTASVSITGKDPKVRAGAVDVVRHWQDLGYLILYVSARPDLQHRKVVAWLAKHNFPHGMVAFMDGLSKDPLRQKYNHMKCLQTEAQVELVAAYGSSKDITIYRELGLQSQQIFIVGKTRKQHGQVQFLSGGYSVHLSQLTSPGFTRPSVGSARGFLRQANFRLSTHEPSRKESKKSAWCNISQLPDHISSRSEFMPLPTSQDVAVAPAIILVQDFSSDASA